MCIRDSFTAARQKVRAAGYANFLDDAFTDEFGGVHASGREYLSTNAKTDALLRHKDNKRKAKVRERRIRQKTNVGVLIAGRVAGSQARRDISNLPAPSPTRTRN